MPRSRAGAEREILATLVRYGFAWNGPIVRQRMRTTLYYAALERLIATGCAYPCICTRRELALSAFGASGERIYPGRCRDGIPIELLRRATRAWRVRVDDRVIAYRDRLLGVQTQILSRDVGDFVVKRSDGLFAYQLAVVVDDAEQAITHVVRGADLAASTARQIFLYQLLDYPVPSYLHVPVATGLDGQKLSKQTFAAPLPVSPIPALLDAWRFLRQREPIANWQPASVDEFWTWTTSAWMAAGVPAVAALCAPAAFREDQAGAV